MFTLSFKVVTLLYLSPHRAVDCLFYVVGLRTIESRNRGWVCLRKLVFGAAQIELDCWISSPQPLKSIGRGSQGLRDCEVEKGLIPSVGCVYVLEVRLALV